MRLYKSYILIVPNNFMDAIYIQDGGCETNHNWHKTMFMRHPHHILGLNIGYKFQVLNKETFCNNLLSCLLEKS